jgi:hypothetical protein
MRNFTILSSDKLQKCLLCRHTFTGYGAHPASCSMGTGGPFPGGKERLRHDADHSPSSCAEVESE